jgi:hypothetical protein
MHAPNISKSHQERNNFFHNPHHILDKLQLNKIILMSNFNTRISNEVKKELKTDLMRKQ